MRDEIREGRTEAGGAGRESAKAKAAAEDIAAVRECMLLHLEQMSRCGVDLYLDGKSVLPGEAVAKAVREDSPYMADYVMDAAGVIEQVRFDKVTGR